MQLAKFILQEMIKLNLLKLNFLEKSPSKASFCLIILLNEYLHLYRPFLFRLTNEVAHRVVVVVGPLVSTYLPTKWQAINLKQDKGGSGCRQQKGKK